MKNLIYIFLLIASTNLYAQGGIENDEMYLKYEQEYLKSIYSSTVGPDYERAKKYFYDSFKDYRDRSKFEKAKEKERWLIKNYSKLNVKDSTEALSLYNTFIESKELLDNNNKFVGGIRNELLKKYDVNLIWETLQTRIKTNK